MRKLRTKLKLRGLVYFSWRDSDPYPPLFQNLWGLHTGLLNENGARKPRLQRVREGRPQAQVAARLRSAQVVFANERSKSSGCTSGSSGHSK